MQHFFKALFVSALLIIFFISQANAKLPEGLYLDDAFTWFETETHYEYNGGKRSDGGWSLKCEMRLHGKVPERSALKLVVKKDGDELATIRNELLVYQADPARFEDGLPVAHTMRCGQEDKQIITAGTGDYAVDIYVIDGSSLKEEFAKTYAIDVQKVEQAGGGTLEGNMPEPGVPEYVISRHGEILSSVIHLVSKGFTSFESKNPATSQNMNTVEIIYNVSGLSQKQPGSEAFFRCTVDGKPITLGKDGRKRADQASSRSMRETVVFHTDRNAMQYRSVPYREELAFRQRVISAPFTFGDAQRRTFGMTALDDHPGEWACSLIENGKTIRTFFWEVAAGKPIVRHDEHEEGLRLGPNTYFIETEIPEGGSFTDERIVADAGKTGFYGRRWESRAAKRRAKELEDVGKPFPIASAPKPEIDPSIAEAAKAKEEAKAATAEKYRQEEEKAELRAAEASAETERKRREAEQAAAAKVAEREADIERLRKTENAAALAAAEAELVEAQTALANAQNLADDARRKANRRSGLHILVGLLLSLALMTSGLCLSGTMLTSRISALAGVQQAITPHAGMLGLASIGLALVDFLFDLFGLRPLIGDGVPQVLGLVGGFLLWQSAKQTVELPEAASEAVEKAEAALQRHDESIQRLQGHSGMVGVGCVIAGLLHLFLSGLPLI